MRYAKEKMHGKLFSVLNNSNSVKCDFKRENFKQYKMYVGRGNNSSLLF